MSLRGAVAVDAATRPRFMPGTRDLDADVTVLNAWLTHSNNQAPRTVSYLPDIHPARAPDHRKPSGGSRDNRTAGPVGGEGQAGSHKRPAG